MARGGGDGGVGEIMRAWCDNTWSRGFDGSGYTSSVALASVVLAFDLEEGNKYTEKKTNQSLLSLYAHLTRVNSRNQMQHRVNVLYHAIIIVA